MKHRGLKATINSLKHYVPFTNTATADAGIRSLVIADSQIAPAATNTFDVREGSVIKAFFLELWLRGNGAAGTSSTFIFIVEKVPSNQASVTAAQMLTLQAYTNKKNILFSSQGVLGDIATSSIPIIRNWILVPKGKQRMGLGDRIVASVAPIGATLNNCGISTYKEFY